MTQTQVASPWFTQQEAAKYSKRGLRSINEALRKGELRGHQPVRCGKWLINVADLDAWIRGEVAPVDVPRVTRPRAASART